MDARDVWWETAIQPYYGAYDWTTNRACQCPAYAGALSDFTELGDLVNQHGGSLPYESYAYNMVGASTPTIAQQLGNGFGLGIGMFESTTAPPPRKDTDIVAPGELVDIMDSRGTSKEGFWYGVDQAYCAESYGYSFYQTPPQHGSFFNVLYTDGHVTADRIPDLFNPQIMAQHWNYDNKPHYELWGAP